MARNDRNSPSSLSLNSLKNSSIKLLSNTDIQIAHIGRLLSTTSKLDTTLLTLSYTLHLFHSVLTRATTARLEAAATALISRLLFLNPPPSTTNASLKANILPLSLLLRLTSSTHALVTKVDDVRTFFRLWGLLGIWSAAASTYRSPPSDGALKALSWAQIGCGAGYQFLENGAYLASNRIVAFAPEKIGRWYTWSSRFWMAHVMLDFLRLARLRNLRNSRRDQESVGVSKGLEGVSEKERGDLAVEHVKEEAKWWRQACTSAAYAPMTVHYSFGGEGWWSLSEGQIAILGLFAGGMGLRDAWADTA
ncbi:hypothetical protein MMC25_003742 [Agyrium rufum]|nr:hypothetical protein [Agyrium rufum]